MLEIPRVLVRQARAVFRRLVPRPTTGGQAAVSFITDGDGLRVRLHQNGVQAELHEPGSHPCKTIAMPINALADFEGKTGTVTLEPVSSNLQARWDDARIPRVVEYEPPDLSKFASFPSTPGNLVAADKELFKALADASRSTARDAIRYATDKIQLRGQTGEIIATDGRLLIQGGFHFPFSDDVLIPSLPVLGCRELLTDGPIAIGKEGQLLFLRIGSWTFFVPIDKDGRYPRVEGIIPTAGSALSQLHIAPEDAAFVAHTLPRLPGAGEENSPITLDLNGHAAIRTRAEGQSRITEVVLAKSEATGAAVRFAVNRELFGRAIELGFRQFEIVNGDTPVYCPGEHKKLVFMPLGTKGSIPPAEDALRIVSAESSPPMSAETPRRIPTMTTPVPANGTSNGHPTTSGAATKGNNPGISDLIDEATALKAILADGFSRCSRLVAALKSHRRQAQAVRATLASLKQLQQVAE